MISLDVLKEDLGDTPANPVSESDLLAVLRRAIQIVRTRTRRYLFGMAHSVTYSGALLTIKSYGHGLSVAGVSKIRLAGTNSTPSTNGDYTITVVDRDTLTAPCSFENPITTAATSGVIHPYFEAEFAGNNKQLIYLPEHICPVAAVDKVSVRQSESDWLELEADEFIVGKGYQTAKVVKMERVNAIWGAWMEYIRSRASMTGQVSVRVTGWSGLPALPSDVEDAVLSICADLYENQGLGRGVSGESSEGVSRQRLSGVEKYEALVSPFPAIEAWKARLT